MAETSNGTRTIATPGLGHKGLSANGHAANGKPRKKALDPRPLDEALRDGKACYQAGKALLSLNMSPLQLCTPDHQGNGKNHSTKCDSPGKAPVRKWGGKDNEICSEADWDIWHKEKPTANLGCAMGKASGVIGVDVDGA